MGDVHFRIKSAHKIKEFAIAEASIILATHEIPIVEKYCDRVIWLDKGRVVKEDNAEDIIREYKRASLK